MTTPPGIRDVSELRRKIEALRVHSIDGYEWECGECHYHFTNSPCYRTGIVSEKDGEYDSEESPANHGELLDRAAVLALLDRTPGA